METPKLNSLTAAGCPRVDLFGLTVPRKITTKPDGNALLEFEMPLTRCINEQRSGSLLIFAASSLETKGKTDFR
jgi:hypothetical protein